MPERHILSCVRCSRTYTIYGELNFDEEENYICGRCEQYAQVIERHLIPSVILFHDWDVRIRSYEHSRSFCVSTYVNTSSTQPLEEEFVNATGGMVQ